MPTADNAAPTELGERPLGAGPRLHHLACAVDRSEVDAARESLELLGTPEYLHAHSAGDVDHTYHHGSASFGHDIEVHADGWDGSDLIEVQD
ncbi:MAG: hypothetical protein JST59_28705 [Actinobacteria bacterium]|nr:hypothetical protein [Actinomycetota bacterium]